MTLYGYARASSLDQDLSLREGRPRAAGRRVVRAEARSGARRAGRTELRPLPGSPRAGDALVVTRVDRLARSLGNLREGEGLGASVIARRLRIGRAPAP